MKSNLYPRRKDIDKAQIFAAHGKQAALAGTVLCTEKSELKSKIYRQNVYILCVYIYMHTQYTGKSHRWIHTFVVFPAHWNDNNCHPCWSQLPAHLNDSFAQLTAWNLIANCFTSICTASNFKCLRKRALLSLHRHYASLVRNMTALFRTASSATEHRIWNWASLRGFGISEGVKVLYQSQIYTALQGGKRRADEAVASSDLFLQFTYLPLT